MSATVSSRIYAFPRTLCRCQRVQFLSMRRRSSLQQLPRIIPVQLPSVRNLIFLINSTIFSGYQDAGQGCSDVDECKINGGTCANSCNNEDGNYSCTCGPDSYKAGNGHCISTQRSFTQPGYHRVSFELNY